MNTMNTINTLSLSEIFNNISHINFVYIVTSLVIMIMCRHRNYPKFELVLLLLAYVNLINVFKCNQIYVSFYENYNAYEPYFGHILTNFFIYGIIIFELNKCMYGNAYEFQPYKVLCLLILAYANILMFRRCIL